MKHPHQTSSPILLPSHRGLRALLQEPSGIRASLYVPVPPHPGFADQQQPERVFSALTRDVEVALQGEDAETAEMLRARLSTLKLNYAQFPKGTRTIAIFCGAHALYPFALRIPVKERAHVGQIFAIQPLLMELQHNVHFRVLSLSQNQVTLYEGDWYGLQALEAPEVPADIQAALGQDFGRAGQGIQAHSAGGQGAGTILHGHGGSRENREIDRDRFYTLIAHSVREQWADRYDPLVLAADSAHQGRFRLKARLAGLLSEGIEGDIERMRPEALHAQAWPIVARWRRLGIQKELDRAGEAMGHNRATADLPSLRAAASTGQVERLWMDATYEWVGHPQPQETPDSGVAQEEDFRDILAAQVVCSGGSVHVLEPGLLPSGSTLLGELRNA